MTSPAGELLRPRRLLLRDWTTSRADVARLEDLYGREEVTRWIGGPPKGPPADPPPPGGGRPAHAARLRCRGGGREDGVVAGTVLFKPLPDGVGEVEVGWHLHPDSWGH